MPSVDFTVATANAVATRLDGDAIHLWRIPYKFAQGRKPLLALLAAYLEIPAPEVVLDQDARGKPHLAHAIPSRTERTGGLEFNWSHSGEFALVAITRDLPLGVDIERLGKELRALEIAHRFFAAAEADHLASLHGASRDRAFIGLWCAKEAVLKAVGEGLSFGLARLAFEQRVSNDWSLVHTDPVLGNAADWQLMSFSPTPGYLGALAWRGEPRRIRAWCPPHTGDAT